MSINIYDYGHWDGLKFIFDEIQTTQALDYDGVQTQTMKVIDFSQAPIPPGTTREDLDVMVRAFLDPSVVAYRTDDDDDEEWEDGY